MYKTKQEKSSTRQKEGVQIARWAVKGEKSGNVERTELNKKVNQSNRFDRRNQSKRLYVGEGLSVYEQITPM